MVTRQTPDLRLHLHADKALVLNALFGEASTTVSTTVSTAAAAAAAGG